MGNKSSYVAKPPSESISPTDDSDVMDVSNEEGEFVRYLIRKSSCFHNYCQEIQQIIKKRFECNNNPDYPIILREVIEGDEYGSDPEYIEIEEYEEEEEQQINSTNENNFILPITDESNPNYKKIDDDPLDFSRIQPTEENIGLIPKSLHNRKTPNQNSDTIIEPMNLQEDENEKYYFYKESLKKWKGWYTVDNPILLTTMKWAIDRKLFQENILDDLEKIQSDPIMNGTSTFDSIHHGILEKPNPIKKLHEKYKNRHKPMSMYLEQCEIVLSKVENIASKIKLETIEDPTLREELVLLNQSFDELKMRKSIYDTSVNKNK